ncbi:ATP-binding protein [soil metagenome]
MKNMRFTIFRRFAIFLFCIITGLGILFIAITYLATTYYHEASTELLNKNVAAHIATFTSPFTLTGISKEKADTVFQNAMVLSPGSEVYFLDTTGKVIYFHASEKEIRQWQVDLKAIAKYIEHKGEKFIKGSDPKDASGKKIFSAAVVKNAGRKLGYIYVILDSKQSENIMKLLFGSHIIKLALQALIIIILLTLLFSLLYLQRISRNFQAMIEVLEKFEAGDYTARFETEQKNELQPVTHAFNKMATLLSLSIEKLTISEQERKNFIANISHDLRTPLSIARGYVETLMLKTEINKEDYDHYTQLIHNKLLQIENLAKQLFELSKMESVEFKLTKEPFVFTEIVRESVNTFQMLAAEKNIILHCSECQEHIWVNADIALIERVVQNLVDNALKNTNTNGIIDITISVDDTKVIFKIENEGNELSNDLLRWINDFNEKNTVTGERPKKAGLGLMIVQKILQLHHSSLKAHTSTGKNIFSFAIPLYEFPS